jgi:hypothetical protein
MSLAVQSAIDATKPLAQPRTVLGEWANDQHYNLGTGPDPTEAGFVEAVTQRLLS